MKIITFTMGWDAWNRLVRVQGGPNNIDISYAYDGLNRRIIQTVTQGTAPSLDFYYNSNWKIIEERDATGAIFAQYIYGERGRNDLIFRDVFSNGTATSQYVLSDAMLSTTSITDATGAILQRYNYTAFGNATLETGSDSFNFPQLFHGEYYDNDTGLSNYGYRYYSPILGRWLGRDPLEEQGGLNFYRFVENDAINLVDFLGSKTRPPPQQGRPTPTPPPPQPPRPWTPVRPRRETPYRPKRQDSPSQSPIYSPPQSPEQRQLAKVQGLVEDGYDERIKDPILSEDHQDEYITDLNKAWMTAEYLCSTWMLNSWERGLMIKKKDCPCKYCCHITIRRRSFLYNNGRYYQEIIHYDFEIRISKNETPSAGCSALPDEPGEYFVGKRTKCIEGDK